MPLGQAAARPAVVLRGIGKELQLGAFRRLFPEAPSLFGIYLREGDLEPRRSIDLVKR